MAGVDQDRRVLRRAGLFVALLTVLLALGLAFKQVADRRREDVALDRAMVEFGRGSLGETGAAVEILESGLRRQSGNASLRSALALVFAHQWLEHAARSPEAQQRIEEAPAGPARKLALAMTEAARGHYETARATLDELQAFAEPRDDAGHIDLLVAQEWTWLDALTTVALAGNAEDLQAALDRVDRALRRNPRRVALRRARASILFVSGKPDEALLELERARDIGRAHFGLAADEALYNAAVHRELGGVASVADQLITRRNEGLSPRDLAQARLARAVAHVRSGEIAEGVDLLVLAWGDLPPWHARLRTLAIETALEAGNGAVVEAWLPLCGLPEPKRAIYRAWTILLQGNVMRALELLEGLPQDDPWVGYLQALALVEQQRFQEAGPWLDRVDAVMPGRVDVEVARARVELHTGDAQRALRKVKALAEEEPYAPRAYTGLGEAYLGQAEAEKDLRAAKQALLKAIEREVVPAEAMLLLARVWNERRGAEADAERKALTLLENAARTNPYLPRYSSEHALYLVDLAYGERARPLLAELADERGVTWRVPVALARLELERTAGAFDAEPLLSSAAALGADARTLARIRAHALTLRDTRSTLAAADASLTELLQKDDRDLEARLLLAWVRAQAGDRKAAKAVLMRGFSVSPESQHGRLQFMLAKIQSKFGQRERAAPWARRAWIEMRDERRPVAELLEVAELAATLWSRDEEHRVAIAIARELTTRIGFHDAAWTVRARIELAAGETASARASAERAVGLAPDNAEAHAILASCLVRYGQKQRAREAYARAIALAAGTEAAEDYRESLARL